MLFKRHNNWRTETGARIECSVVRENAIVPTRNYDTDAGYDCYASIFFKINEAARQLVPCERSSFELYGLQRVAVGLGIKTNIPAGWFVQLCPRSGNALWRGLTVLNSPAIIDAEYKNEWIAIIQNASGSLTTLELGERVCQAVLMEQRRIDWRETEELTESSPGERGMNGLGSSGN